MKTGAPVDLDLAALEKVAPALQADRGDMVRGGVMRSRHSAPRHRLDMHRPERLDGDRTLGLAQRRRAPATTQETLLAQEFRRFPGAIGAFQGLQW
jgi:hypothetical protein